MTRRRSRARRRTVARRARMVKSVDADDLESATPMGTNETTIRCATARDALVRCDATRIDDAFYVFPSTDSVFHSARGVARAFNRNSPPFGDTNRSSTRTPPTGGAIAGARVRNRRKSSRRRERRYLRRN